MTGLASNITGTTNMLKRISHVINPVEPSHNGCLSSPPMAMTMSELITLGGPAGKSACNHLYKIMKSIQPKKQSIKMAIGTHSHAMSTRFRSCHALLNRKPRPTSICSTPNNTDSFIFKEFVKSNSFEAPCQAQSKPNGYGPRPLPVFFVSAHDFGWNSPVRLPSGSWISSHRDSKNGSPMEKKSLYIKPANTAKNPISTSINLAMQS
mmetsp:Transcript_26083/g.60267  ORF Transcript_26083/g.60267 Transcript_26083/m.60267 type:complete len:208 (-) Transcript_26083:1171-1794(-)